MSHKAVFAISFDFGDLTEDEIWPDGDAPANPTAEDVLAVIRRCGGTERVIHDWNLVGAGEGFDVALISPRKDPTP